MTAEMGFRHRRINDYFLGYWAFIRSSTNGKQRMTFHPQPYESQL
jgi:hypothetical protein